MDLQPPVSQPPSPQIAASPPAVSPPPPVQTTVVAPSISVSSPVEYAGFGQRYLAYYVDNMIVSIISGGMMFFSIRGRNFSFFAFPVVLLSLAYFVFFWVKSNGQTLGNKLMAIRVIKEDGSNLEIGGGILRYIGYLISSFILGLGFLWVAFDAKKQGWHDKIAQTLVVKTDKKPKTFLAILILLLPVVFSMILVAIMGVGIFAAIMGMQKKGSINSSPVFDQFMKNIPGASETLKSIPTIPALP